jgi:hypothetical protein
MFLGLLDPEVFCAAPARILPSTSKTFIKTLISAVYSSDFLMIFILEADVNVPRI